MLWIWNHIFQTVTRNNSIQYQLNIQLGKVHLAQKHSNSSKKTAPQQAPPATSSWKKLFISIEIIHGVVIDFPQILEYPDIQRFPSLFLDH